MEHGFIILSLLCFAGFFRINELLSVRLKHITFLPEHIEIFLPHAKTDQHRDWEVVYIARTGTKYCPVFNLEIFLLKAKLEIDRDKEAFLIPTLHKTKKGHNASKTRGISYSRAYEIFHENLHICQIDSSSYGLHSYRAGGTTQASNNGVSERLISKHGRWSADTSRNGYIKDSKKKRLRVTQSLEL